MPCCCRPGCSTWPPSTPWASEVTATGKQRCALCPAPCLHRSSNTSGDHAHPLPLPQAQGPVHVSMDHDARHRLSDHLSSTNMHPSSLMHCSACSHRQASCSCCPALYHRLQTARMLTCTRQEKRALLGDVQVRNGRLAMIANLGFWVQAAVTKKSLVQNIDDHIADPGHNNSAPLTMQTCICEHGIALNLAQSDSIATIQQCWWRCWVVPAVSSAQV